MHGETIKKKLTSNTGWNGEQNDRSVYELFLWQILKNFYKEKGKSVRNGLYLQHF